MSNNVRLSAILADRTWATVWPRVAAGDPGNKWPSVVTLAHTAQRVARGFDLWRRALASHFGGIAKISWLVHNYARGRHPTWLRAGTCPAYTERRIALCRHLACLQRAFLLVLQSMCALISGYPRPSLRAHAPARVPRAAVGAFARAREYKGECARTNMNHVASSDWVEVVKPTVVPLANRGNRTQHDANRAEAGRSWWACTAASSRHFTVVLIRRATRISLCSHEPQARVLPESVSRPDSPEPWPR